MSDESGARTCPACGSSDTKQYDTRHVDDRQTLRLRICLVVRCGHKWTTVEEAARKVWLRTSVLLDEQ